MSGRPDRPWRLRPRSVIALPLVALFPALLGGCGGEDSTPSGPQVDLRPLTVVISLVRDIDILGGRARVNGYGGDHEFLWARHSSSGSTTVSVVEDRFSTWRFDIEGRQIIESDTTGTGLLYTQTRDVDMLAIGDTLGVRLDFVVPRVDHEIRTLSVRVEWQMDVPRALYYEFRQVRAGHPDSVFTIAATDTTISRATITDRRRYQVRGVLRDDQVSAYSVPIVLAP